MNLVQKLRLRVLAILVATALAVIGAVSIASLPVWPVLGVAVTAAVLVVNRVTSRLSDGVCWECGGTIEGRPAGEYGVECPGCGALNTGVRLAVGDRPEGMGDRSSES